MELSFLSQSLRFHFVSCPFKGFTGVLFPNWLVMYLVICSFILLLGPSPSAEIVYFE